MMELVLKIVGLGAVVFVWGWAWTKAAAVEELEREALR